MNLGIVKDAFSHIDTYEKFVCDIADHLGRIEDVVVCVTIVVLNLNVWQLMEHKPCPVVEARSDIL